MCHSTASEVLTTTKHSVSAFCFSKLTLKLSQRDATAHLKACFDLMSLLLIDCSESLINSQLIICHERRECATKIMEKEIYMND